VVAYLSVIEQYLNRYAEPEAGLAEQVVHKTYRNTLIIPCFDEAENFLDHVLPRGMADLLVIVVVNAPQNAPEESLARTARLMGSLTGGGSRMIGVVPYSGTHNVDVLVIDRASNGRRVPPRQGVGLARKIGADISLKLYQRGSIIEPWLYSTDADATLPEVYFTTQLEPEAVNLFGFHHKSQDPHLHASGQLYETYLRYYVNRLRHAGSPYAYHTLGSTMAIPVCAYAKVRGFPKRNAGEDFYVLNKLAKVGPIHSLLAPEIELQSRASTRVPFGTGPAIIRMPEDPTCYLSYAPECFDELKALLDNLRSAQPGTPWQNLDVADKALQALGFFEFFARAQRQFKSPTTLQKALHQWLDAFRTLRFIHEIRHTYGDVPLLETLDVLLGTPADGHLERLRNLERGAIGDMGTASHKQAPASVQAQGTHPTFRSGSKLAGQRHH